jgi:aminoglycoside 6'-N-acetyltransferase I
MDRGRARGCEEAWVGTEPDNEATNAFYQALGSEPETFRLHLFRLGDPA